MRRWPAIGMSSKPTTDTSSGTRRPCRSSSSISAIAITSLVQQTAVAVGRRRRPAPARGGRAPPASPPAGVSTDSSWAPEWAKAMRRWPSSTRWPTSASIAADSSTTIVPSRGSRPSNDTTTTGMPRSSSSVGMAEPAVTAGKMTPSTRRPTSARTWAASFCGIVLGLGHQHREAVAVGAPLDLERDGRVEGVERVGDGDAERARGLPLQRAGDLVLAVAQLLDRIQHTAAGVRRPPARSGAARSRRWRPRRRSGGRRRAWWRSPGRRLDVAAPPAAPAARRGCRPRRRAADPRARSRRRRRSRRRAAPAAARDHSDTGRPAPTAAKCQVAVSGSTGKRMSMTPSAAIRSACSSVSLPWQKPMRSPSSSITRSGSMPCHQKWLGSKLTPPPRRRPRPRAGTRTGCRPRRPACSSRQISTPGAWRRAQPPSSRQNGASRSRYCHSHSGSSSGTSAHGANTGLGPPSRPPGQPLMVTTRSTPSSAASSTAPRTSAAWRSPTAGSGCSGLPAAFTHDRAEAVLAQLAAQPVARGRIAQQRRPAAAGGAPSPSRPRPSRSPPARAPRTRRTPARGSDGPTRR